MLGKNRENMPDPGFKLMTFFFKIIDIFSNIEKYVKEFGVNKGDVVIDYGCGPARYVKPIAKIIGDKGILYAVDIHKLAIEAVGKEVEKHQLKNVKAVLAQGYSCDIKDHCADLILSLDMFHMIQDTTKFLQELHRLLKKDGVLILEDGHQKRNSTKQKVTASKLWEITEETKKFLRCRPLPR